MANQQDTNRGDMIRCEFCGEDYSATYRKCPFCDGTASRSGARTSGKSGKRQLLSNLSNLSIDPARIIGLALGLILIIAAIYIVYSVLAPLFGGKPAVKNPTLSQPSVSISQPAVSTPDISTTNPDVVTPVVPDPATPVSGSIGVVSGTSTGLRVRQEASTSSEILASLTNGSEVTILEKVDDSWYHISYSGLGGVTAYGYVSTAYITLK